MSKVLSKTVTQGGFPMTDKRKKDKHIPDMIEFLNENVYNISDITRHQMLTKILNSFSGAKSEEVFIVQNSKHKEAQAALIDVDYLLELLKYKELIDELTKDELVYETAIMREGSVAELSIGEVAAQFDLNWEEIMKAKQHVDID